MIRAYSRYMREFDRESGFVSGPHRAVFYALCACLSMYIAFITFFMYSPVFESSVMTLLSLAVWLIESFLIFSLWPPVLRRLKGLQKPARSGRLSPGFFAAASALCAGILLIRLLSRWPGCVSYDVYNQWEQARTGVFSNWHPAAHTMLIWLVTRVCGDYSFVLIVQILLLSLSLGYLLSTAERHGAPRAPLLAAEVLTVTSSIVSDTAMFLWKDNAMSIGVMIVTAQCLNVYQTRGAWLKRPRNAVMLGLALCFTTLMRHNAFMFTLPICVILPLCYMKSAKKLLPALCAFAACYIAITGPLYGAVGVEYPDNLLEESIGLPMTMVFDIRLKNEQALPEKTREYLNSLISREDFEEKYVPSNYNSIKFEYPREAINEKPAEFFLDMFASAAACDPRNAFLSAKELTDMVWDITGKNEGTVSAVNNGDMEDYRFWNTHINQIGLSAWRALTAAFRAPPFTYLTQNIGVQLLLLLAAALLSVWRCGPFAMAFGLAPLIYDLGTMLLLCGPDTRFFQFNMLICLPVCLALFKLPPEEDDA